MEHFDVGSAEELEKPVLKGTICSARFSLDKKWYRCRVNGTVAKGAVSVQFIDYGNTEIINAVDGAMPDLRKLPKNLLAFEPQSIACSLAFLKVPRIDKTCGKEASAYLKKYSLEKVHDAVVASESSHSTKLILMLEGESDFETSINAYMVSEGLATLVDDIDDAPDEVQAWLDYE